MVASVRISAPIRRPEEIGLEKIFLFPEKLSALTKNELDLSYPVSVELSLTSRCNLDCLWCSDRTLRSLCPDLLTPEILESLFYDLAQGGTRGITIEGGGEPTLSPLFDQTVKAAIKANLSIGLITNGLSLFPPDRDPALYSHFQWIRVSLDAANREDFKKLKGRDSFDTIMENLSFLSHLNPRPTLGAGYVLCSENDDPNGLTKLALKLRSLCFDYLHLRPVVDHPELVSQRNVEFLKELETADFSINITALTDNQDFGNGGLGCLAHSLSAVITADGSLWLCGRLNFDLLRDSLGSLTTQSFADIWQGEKRRAQSLKAKNPIFCQKHCPQCRMTKYNRLIDKLRQIRTRDFI